MSKLRRGWFGCYIWTGSIIPCGKPGYQMRYGQFYFDGGPKKAHRYAYERARGPIPDGLVIDHLCRNPLCQNAWHMEVVTRGENARRGDPGRHNREKTHCPQGHEYTPENTYRKKNNGRACRACTLDRRYIARHPLIEVAA